MTTFDSSKLVKPFYLLADLLLKNRVRVLSGILCNMAILRELKFILFTLLVETTLKRIGSGMQFT